MTYTTETKLDTKKICWNSRNENAEENNRKTKNETSTQTSKEEAIQKILMDGYTRGNENGTST